ncbi:MAG: DPP IV N-terminal domain-containing protein [Paludibacteraceae bacterium]|nr:DPP IV N-terminal domain-containing protein [Paludibacteraceae bacterium]
MYRFLFSVILLSVSVLGHADRLMDIMQNYNAKTMSTLEMDSVLASKENSQTANNRYRLEYENEQKLFRHSFFADYYLVDTQKGNARTRVSDAPIRDAKMSPNGKYVVYAKADNNLYIYKVDFKTEVAITTDTNTEIFNGISDWLYEEEFGTTGLFAFSPDNKQVAFVRLNETEVPTFSWQTYLNNEAEGETTPMYPQLHSLRYPKAGSPNAKASICIYDIYYKTIRTMELPDKMDGYLPRVTWTPLSKPTKKGDFPTSDVVILHLNRDQNKMDVLKGNPKSTVCHPFYSEESKKYFVNYELFDQWQWLDDGRVIVISEKGGYAQAYLYNTQGMEQRLLTPEERDITKVYGYDPTAQTLYYQAANTPMTRQAYALNVRKNTTTCLTKGEGTHDLHFSADWKRYIQCYHSTTTPHTYTLHKAVGNGQWAMEKTVLDNDSILQAWKALGINEKEFFTITTERGDVLNAWRILPKNFDKTKKYPVIMLQYSGPTSQRVLNNWRKRFGYALADAGYLVVNVDGRGTGARGREWRNATYMQLGVKEAEDQISAAKYLQTLPYVDANRIAICGWSYGGYQTLICLSKQASLSPLTSHLSPLFKCGIAIAPVTSWRLYDSAYTERFMRRPQVNDFGYEGTDLMKMAGDLTGELLIVHGLADDNVHAQNTLLYTDALVKAGKQFEMQLYVDDNHSIRKPHNYKHLHHRIMLFLENNL